MYASYPQSNTVPIPGDAVQQQEEAGWIARCRAGEADAFRPLVQRYERMVRSLVRRLMPSDAEIDDVAQQTFVTAFDRLGQYAGDAKFSTWLCRIALNKCRDQLRGRRRRAEDDIGEMDFASEQQGPEQVLIDKQMDLQLQGALNKLKRGEREIIVFKYVCDYSYETVAAILNCSVTAAKVRSLRARERLKEVLLAMGVVP